MDGTKVLFLYNTRTKKPDTPKNKENDNSEGKRYNRSKTVTYFLINRIGDKVHVCTTFNVYCNSFI